MSQAQAGTTRAREYETIYILKPDIDAESAELRGGRGDSRARGGFTFTPKRKRSAPYEAGDLDGLHRARFARRA